MFMEALCRQGHQATKHMIHHPGLIKYPYGASSVPLPENDTEIVSRITPGIFSESPFLSYCKLHGSWAWHRSNCTKPIHVTGANKLDAIKCEPLLRWYFELFKKALNRSGVRLLVIGYGFNDRHINDVVRAAVREHGLKLCVVDPRGPQRFNGEFVHPKGEGHTLVHHQDIWEGV